MLATPRSALIVQILPSSVYVTGLTLGGTVMNNDGVFCALITAAGGRAVAGSVATVKMAAAIAKMAAREEMDEGVINIVGA